MPDGGGSAADPLLHDPRAALDILRRIGVLGLKLGEEGAILLAKLLERHRQHEEAIRSLGALAILLDYAQERLDRVGPSSGGACRAPCAGAPINVAASSRHGADCFKTRCVCTADSRP